MRTRIPAILLASLALLSACGDETEPVTSIAGLEGPPSYKRAREDMPARSALILRARSACSLRFRIEFTGEPTEVGKMIPVARGESVRLWWGHAVLEDPMETKPPADMVAQGRTEVRVPSLSMGLEGMGDEVRSRMAWVRPDHALEVSKDLFVSAEDQVLEFGGDLELVTVVVADVDGTEVTLQPREGRHHVRLRPAKLGADERIYVIRLFLEVHPAGS